MAAIGANSEGQQDEESNLPHVEFVHERRNSNVDTYRLARSSISMSLGIYVWFLSPPDGVCNSIMS
jgi:hypothetical protein